MNKVISSDGSATLFNEHYGQTYHSVHGATTESKLVYLVYSGVEARIARGLDTHILEIGFGLGLNFLTTAKCALQTSTKLTYLSIENAPISKETFLSLNYDSISGFANLTDTTAEIFDTLSSGQHASGNLFGQVSFDVQRNDAVTCSFEQNAFDAIYLDAFSPEANPELWSQPFLKQLLRAMKPGGKLSTYCVKGTIRRSLVEVGFEVTKMPGPPGKREVLVGKRKFGEV